MKQFTVKLIITMTDEQIAAWQKATATQPDEPQWPLTIEDVPDDVANYIADELIPKSKMPEHITDVVSATATKARNRKA